MSDKVPATMMTQHPDSASRYVPIQEEPVEAITALTPPPGGYGIDEVMVDFEGKLTPYHQTAQVVHGLFDAGLVPGRDVFVTPRIASATKETTFKQLMALLSVVETNFLASELHSVPAVTEVVLPMVTSAEEVISARRRIEHVIQLAHDEFGISNDKNAITVIPLVEEIPQLVGIKEFFKKYIDLCRAEGFDVSRLRYMVARSDPALSYGLVSAVLAAKVAVARGYELAEEREVTVLPILGAGSLPFRGHITPDNIGNILSAYGGVRTLTIQSGLRYDHPRDDVLGMIDRVTLELQKTKPLTYTPEEFERIINLIGVFTRTYVEAFTHIMGAVCRVSDFIPQQRDRLARKSEVGYARDIARPEKLAEWVTDREVKSDLMRLDTTIRIELPRAISFTAALYTLGYPPEFIGTGRGLKEVSRRYGAEGVRDILGFYPGIKVDLDRAGRSLHLENAGEFFPHECMRMLEEDAHGVSEVLGVELGPKTDEDEQHRTLMEVVRPVLKKIVHASSAEAAGSAAEGEFNVVKDCIIRMGKLRGSLG